MEESPVQIAVPVPGFPSPLCYDPGRDRLGSGGASDVFRATVTATAAATATEPVLAGVGGRVYALKQFRQPRRPGEDDHANETAVLAALACPARHPHIQYGLASWTGGGNDPSTPRRSPRSPPLGSTAAAVSYLLFELAPGGDLWAFLRDTPSPAFPPGPEFVDSILAQMQGLCDGLAYVHDCTLEGGRRRIGFHHDLKTSNIMLCCDGGGGGGGITPSPPPEDARHPYVWKLGDFGCGAVNLVPAGGDSDGHELSSRPSSTGDPIYTAPEYIVEDKLGRPKDVWALGCVFLDVLVWALAGAGLAGASGSNAAAAATPAPAVEAFRHARDQYCHLSPDNAPAFWCIDPVTEQPFVNPAATAAVAEMEAATRRCEAAVAGRFAAVLDVVSRRMVVVEKAGRASAAEVRDRLAALRGVAR